MLSKVHRETEKEVSMKKLVEMIPKPEDIREVRLHFILFGFSLFGLGMVVATQLFRWGILT
jgi:hypothetical protein